MGKGEKKKGNMLMIISQDIQMRLFEVLSN
jgi:hypothetical protein